METVKCIAEDWSGRKDERQQRKHIWRAEAQSKTLIRLENGRTRDETVTALVDDIRSGVRIVIGLDFGFSLPQWYLHRRGLQSVRQLWDLASTEGELWLSGEAWPFWGRPGPFEKRPADLVGNLRFRETEEDIENGNPKSVFQVFGGGAVGTGTIRGLPALARLQAAGAAVWPFDALQTGKPRVIEIYPRLFYGSQVVNNRTRRGEISREAYLRTNFPNLQQDLMNKMIKSDDAFDAGISALVMSAHAEDLHKLQQTAEPRKCLEGEIWSP